MEMAEQDVKMDTGQEIPQTLPISGDMVLNSAGGYTWKVSDMQRLRRFLCLGSENGSYYIGEKKLGLENAQCISKLIAEGKGLEVVQEIKTMSTNGRAAKQDPAIFALAICARQTTDMALKEISYDSLMDICRIPTHLFRFVECAEGLGQGTGWGRAHRRGICKWYNRRKNIRHLANLVTKYRNRNGWTHKDVLRLCHIKPESDGIAAIICYIVKGLDISEHKYLKPDSDNDMKNVFNFLRAVEVAKRSTTEAEILPLISEYQLVREHIPTGLLNSESVWMALLQNMPMTAMIRNLGKMSAVGLFENEGNISLVVDRLQSEDILKSARVHPFNIFVAYKTYIAGKVDKCELTWPCAEICDALNAAFYKSFKFVEPTNKRYCLAVDVSGSMWGEKIMGNNAVDAASAAASLAMVTAKIEPQHEIMAFSDEFVDLPVTANMTLEEVLAAMDNIPMGNTDCALPMIWAAEKEKPFDVFVVYTDSETYMGKIHAAEALRHYRQKMGIWDAKLIVCAFCSNKFTIADPEDPGMLDMAGFDSAAPEVIRNFSLGLL